MKETVKFNLWVKCFYDKDNKETYGNATRSALMVYNTTNYNSASVIGSENLRKLKIANLVIAEQEGYGLAVMIRIGLAKMLKGSYSDWEKFMIFLGYYDQEKPIVVNSQINNYDFSNLASDIAKSRKERDLSN